MPADDRSKRVPHKTPYRASLFERTGERHLVQYLVDFVGPNGEQAWWEVLFIGVEEATRWAKWELERIANGQPGWPAHVLQGHWEHAKRTAGFVIDTESLASLGPSIGASPAADTDET